MSLPVNIAVLLVAAALLLGLVAWLDRKGGR